MTAGSAAQVLLAWEPPDASLGACRAGALLPRGADDRAAARVGRKRRPSASQGVASVSAPVFGPDGRVVAAVSVSGPIDRLTRQPGRLHAAHVTAAARALSHAIGWRGATAS